MSRSYIRPDQLDSNGNYSFAQLKVNGYSAGDLNEGYLTGLILEAANGSDMLRLHADDGEIEQIGSGIVTFNGNVTANANVVIEGNLTVNGTTTTIDTAQMIVTDPVTIINASGLESFSDWTGFSARDTDGYNRIGWVFAGGSPEDGYWAVSVDFSATAQPDALPNRALAYIAEGDGYGDLSSTISGNSGATKVAISTIVGMTATNVQAALQELSSGGAISGTTSNNFTVNTNATPSIDEDACLIMKGGDGVALIEGYMCLVSDSTNGDRIELKLYQSSSRIDSRFHVGPLSVTDNIDSYLVFNAGDGTNARTASIKLDGTLNRLDYTANKHYFTGPVVSNNRFDAYGHVQLGDAYAVDTLNVQATIVSDLVPTNCTYLLGHTNATWLDGYFCMFTPTNYTPVGDSDSLQGHLKGIDNKLADTTVDHPRGVYKATAGEATADEIASTRSADQGDTVDVGTVSDAVFRDNFYIFWNGQLLWNDPSPAATQLAVANDVARKTGSLSTLIFKGNVKLGDIVQIVDMR